MKTAKRGFFYPWGIWLLIAVASGSSVELYHNFFSRNEEFTPLIFPEEYDFVFDKSEIGNERDPYARFNYHINLQVDPKTGRIPWGIYQKERAFVGSIPKQRPIGGINLRTLEEDWEPLGPTNVGGRTRAFAVDVTDENVLLAGSVSGSFWRSEDGGQTWEITSDINNLVGVTALTQDIRSGRENIWYYGTGEIRGNSASARGAPYRGDGVFKSTDGGRSWVQLPSTQVPVRDLFNSQFNYIYDIIVNHTKLDIDEVYLAAYGGILRSEDGGDSWSAVLGDQLFGLPEETDLNGANSPFFTEIKISQSGTFYAYLSEETSSGYDSLGRGVFRSENGVDWDPITPLGLPDSANRAVMAIAPTNENIVFMFVDHGDRESPRHSLWKYEHRSPVGEWTDLSENVPAFGGDFGDMDTQDSYNMVIEVHPSDEDIVFVGGTNLYRSLDGFRTRDNQEWIAGYDTTNNGAQWPNHHADQHSLLFLKEPPFRLYSTHDGGISFTNLSTIERPLWISLNSGYITTQFYAITMQQDQATNFVAGGAQDNGSWLAFDDSLGPWNRLLGGDGSYAAIGERQRFFYASAQDGRVFRVIINFAENRIQSLSQVDPVGAGEKEGQEYLFINPFILDPNDTDRMYIAGGDAIWRNQNLAQIPAGRREKSPEGWERLESTNLPDTGQITTLVASIDVPNRLYYGTSVGKLFRIDSAHRGDGIVTELTDEIFPFGYISNVNLNPDNADELIVIFSNYAVQSIFHSIDGGASFESVAGNLEEFEDGSGNGPSVRWGTIVPLANGSNKYFVGTSSGLFSTDRLQGLETDWLREGANAIGLAIVNMIQYRPLDGRIVVATHGNGVFVSQVEGFRPLDPPGQEAAPLEITSTFPNPFRERVDIEFTIPEDATVLARVFDLSGNTIRTVLAGTQLAGTNHLSWDGRNNFGNAVPNGIYIMNILYEGESESRRLILDR